MIHQGRRRGITQMPSVHLFSSRRTMPSGKAANELGCESTVAIILRIWPWLTRDAYHCTWQTVASQWPVMILGLGTLEYRCHLVSNGNAAQCREEILASMSQWSLTGQGRQTLCNTL